MKVSIIWEDRLGVETKSFGPHEVLISGVALETGAPRKELAKLLQPVPKKGNGNVKRALASDYTKLGRLGPVIAVLDRDKAHQLWTDVPRCISGIKERCRTDAPGEYDLILVEDNTESILDAIRRVSPTTPLSDDGAKPTPEERDQICNRFAWDPDQRRFEELYEVCPSFRYLVKRVSLRLRESGQLPSAEESNS